jgi:hypothetical protein
MEPTAPRGQRLTIDFFFRSLAQDQRERAIGIVLSGTGVGFQIIWSKFFGLFGTNFSILNGLVILQYLLAVLKFRPVRPLIFTIFCLFNPYCPEFQH